MKLPSFDDFLATITEEQILGWIQDGPTTQRIESEIAVSSAYALNLLRAYHEWISAVIREAF